MTFSGLTYVSPSSSSYIQENMANIVLNKCITGFTNWFIYVIVLVKAQYESIFNNKIIIFSVHD